jgi:osmotically-inducible protein OsmY
MKKSLLLTLLLFGFASPTFASDRTNFEVFRDVSQQVNRYVYFTIFDSVSADVDAGYVTLSGKVTMPYKASDIEKRVARIDGVKGVRNTITVLPVSPFDDSLRLRIARAIYAHPALSMYGLGPNPSIHIIVERGRVTLDGVVNNEMDRTIANSVARSFLAFDVKNELKTSHEMEQQMEKL